MQDKSPGQPGDIVTQFLGRVVQTRLRFRELVEQLRALSPPSQGIGHTLITRAHIAQIAQDIHPGQLRLMPIRSNR